MKKTITTLLAAATLLGGASILAQAETMSNAQPGMGNATIESNSKTRSFDNRVLFEGDVDADVSLGMSYSQNQTMSCDDARDMVGANGFPNATSEDCVGPRYSFRTNDDTRSEMIFVNAKTGVIIGG